jgi:hypothetical protein
VGEIREIKTIVSINQKHEIQRQKDDERKKELRVFDEEKIAELPAITFCDEEKRVVSGKLEFKRLSYELKLTPEMREKIEAIQLEIVQVSFSDEDMDTVAHHLDLYNQIYKEVSGRFNARPLNKYSGELAILTARINVRSLLWRSLYQLKLRLDEEAKFPVLGCPYKALNLDHVKLGKKIVQKNYGNKKLVYETWRTF